MTAVVTLLTIDASGAEAGKRQYVAAMNESGAATQRVMDLEAKAAEKRRQALGIYSQQGDAMARTARAYEKLRASADPLIAQSQAIARAQGVADAAFRRGLATQSEATAIMDLVRTKYSQATVANENFSKATGGVLLQSGLARHELINLGRQVQDVGTMFAMGASPMQVFSSQAAQVFDIFASSQGTMGGFFKQLSSGIAQFAMSRAGLLTGISAIGTGIAYSAIQFVDSQKAIENALQGIGRASGATIYGINRLADAEAAAAKVSVASAREIASGYASTGKVDPTRIPGLIGFTKQYSSMRGMGLDDATKELGGAFADPLRGMTQLQDRIGGLSSASRQWIEDLALSGNRLAAQNALVQVFSQSVDGATERTGFWAQTFGGLGRFLGNASDGLGKAVAGSRAWGDQLDILKQKRELLASLPANALGASNQVAMLDTEIRKLEAIVQLEGQRLAIDQRVRRENAALVADDLVRDMDPRIKQVVQWREEVAKLNEAINLNPSSGRMGDWKQSRDAYQNAIDRSISSAERERQLGDLNIRAINARTLAERGAIAVDRERLEISRGVISVEEERIRLANRLREVQAQSSRDLQDELRRSSDVLSLAGKSPGERFRIEQDQLLRDRRERFGGVDASMPATTMAANGLDAAFAATLKRMVAEVPGLSITSGFRSYDQQAKLYAEKPGWAAKPGTSNHEFGVAADIAYKGSGQLPAWLREKLAAEYGVSFPLANRARNPEPWHVEPNGGRSMATGRAGEDPLLRLRREAYSAREAQLTDDIIGSTNRELERQRALLLLQRDAWGQSAEQIAKASKEQELINALQQQGIAISPALRAQIDQTASGYGALARQTEELKQSQEAMKTLGDTGRSVLGGIYSDLRNGASGADLLRNSLDKVASKLMDMAMNDLFGKAFGNNGMGLFGNGGGGFLGGLMNFFRGSGSSDPLDFSRGSTGLYGPGFAFGGYTGPGGRLDPAGIVHRGEYVFSAASVNRIGLSNLDTMHRSSLRGYAGGGYVNPAPYAAPAANQNWGGLKVDIHNTVSDRVEARAEQREDGSLRIVVAAIKGDIAQDIVRGQGSVSTAIRSVQSGRQLRG